MMLDITLSQIKYTLQSGMLVNPEDAFTLCDALDDFVTHMERMAERGRKFVTEDDPGAVFELYHNEIAHSINVLLLKSGRGDMLYLGFANPQFMYAHTGPALTNAERWLRMLRQNATPVTKESRKERRVFFSTLQRKISRARTELEAIVKIHAL
jgi:hypothetical protein